MNFHVQLSLSWNLYRFFFVDSKKAIRNKEDLLRINKSYCSDERRNCFGANLRIFVLYLTWQICTSIAMSTPHNLFWRRNRQFMNGTKVYNGIAKCEKIYQGKSSCLQTNIGSDCLSFLTHVGLL